MTELPKGWAKGPFSEFIQPRGEKASPSDHPDLKFIGMDHVEAHTMRIIGAVPASDMKSSAARFYKHDVLYGRLRPYLNKVAQPKFDGLASAEFIVFGGNELVDASFLRYRLNSRDFVNFANHLNEGDRPRVSFDQFGNYELLIPPLNEQRRIVEKIEAMFGRIDKGVENLRGAKATLALYRQSLLKSAFEGKLTADWRAQNAGQLETPKTLLARIQKERETRYKSALDDWQTALSEWRAAGEVGRKPGKPGRPKEETNHPLFEVIKLKNIPKEWALAHIVEVIDIVSGGTPKGIEDCRGSDFPFFKVSDMNTQGNEKFLSASPIHASAEEVRALGLSICPAETIVFPKRGGAILTNKKRLLKQSAAFDLNIMGLVNNTDTIRNDFVWFWAQSFNLSTIYDGSNVPQINNKNVEPLSFPVCSPAEQAEITRILDARLTAADRMEAEIDAALSRADALRQSILKRAFAGNLVPQDPTDEPAPTLLARIKAERAKAGKTKPRKTAHAG
jgi:type I restriction enzyme S subunit